MDELNNVPETPPQLEYKDTDDLDARRLHLSRKIAATPLPLTPEQQKQITDIYALKRQLEESIAHLQISLDQANDSLWKLEKEPAIITKVGKCYLAHRWNMPPTHAEDYYDEFIRVVSYDKNKNSYIIETIGNNTVGAILNHTKLPMAYNELEGFTEITSEEFNRIKSEMLSLFEG